MEFVVTSVLEKIAMISPRIEGYGSNFVSWYKIKPINWINSRWRRPPFWISSKYHFYAMDGRILIKFGMRVQHTCSRQRGQNSSFFAKTRWRPSSYWILEKWLKLRSGWTYFAKIMQQMYNIYYQEIDRANKTLFYQNSRWQWMVRSRLLTWIMVGHLK